MKLPHKTVIELTDALSRLDGVSPDTPYKFGPKVRYSLAKNLRILRRKVEDIDKARVALVREIWPGGDGAKKDKDSAEFERFSSQWQAFLESEEDVDGLMRFQFGELQLDINNIPVTVLASLGPLILEEGA